MAREAAKRGKRVLFIIHRRELLQQIAEDVGPHENIQLASVQSIVRRLSHTEKPDLIISDEFHHGTAATWRKIFDYFSDAYLVGLTATPARTNGQGLGEICDRLIIGPQVQELIDAGYLAPYKYFAPPVSIDLSEVKIRMGDYDQTELAVAVDRPHITGQALDHYKTLAGGKQAIIYCASIQHSKNTAAAFRESGIDAAHVDGETPEAQRDKAVADFKAGRLTVISNVNLFGEGLNLPNVEVVILLRPTQSLILNVQQSMRSMRPGPGKTAIIIDAVGNCYRHGLPADPHVWTLEGAARKKSDPSTVSIRICDFCYSAFAPAPVCPYCGAVMPIITREIKLTPGELEEIKKIERRNKKLEEWQARTIADLKQIATARGYASGWVYMTAKRRGIKS
jgi:superfamily II DNA or RNA helicase